MKYGISLRSRRGLVGFLGAIALSLPLMLWDAPALAQRSSSAEQALQQGRVVLTGDNGQYVGRVLVNAPISTAWAVLTDYDNFEQFFPNVASSQLISSSGNQRVFEQENVVRLLAFTRRTRVRIATVESYPQQIAFQVIDGDIEALQGVWQLQTVGNQNQVLITHQVYIDPGSSNREIFFTLYRDNLESTLAALKREIERRAR